MMDPGFKLWKEGGGGGWYTCNLIYIVFTTFGGATPHLDPSLCTSITKTNTGLPPLLWMKTVESKLWPLSKYLDHILYYYACNHIVVKRKVEDIFFKSKPSCDPEWMGGKERRCWGETQIPTLFNLSNKQYDYQRSGTKQMFKFLRIFNLDAKTLRVKQVKWIK